MGFEPMKELPLYTLSKRAPSTTRPPLLKINIIVKLKTHYTYSCFLINNQENYYLTQLFL